MAIRPSTNKQGGTTRRAKFEYRPRTAGEVSKRAHQSAGGKEGFVAQEINTWTPADGDNKIRILPPTWPDAGHFGFEVFAHYGVGPDNGSFLCPFKNPSESEGGAKPDDLETDCPICNARREAQDEGDDDLASQLRWKKRVGMWIIDRSQESKGPLLWFAPWTLDQEIAKQSQGEDGEVLALDHPEEGYDVSFTREKGVGNTPPKYTGVKIARKPSPIFDDEDDVAKVLEYITETPVPATLVFAAPDAIAAAFAGGAGKNETAEEKNKTSTKPKFGAKPAAKTEPATKPKGKLQMGKKKEEPEPEPEGGGELPTWDEVHEMDEEALASLAEDNGVDFENREFNDLASVQDFVCEALEIAEPEPEPEPEPEKPTKPKIGMKPRVGAKPAAEPAKPSWKDRLQKFKK